MSRPPNLGLEDAVPGPACRRTWRPPSLPASADHGEVVACHGSPCVPDREAPRVFPPREPSQADRSTRGGSHSAAGGGRPRGGRGAAAPRRRRHGGRATATAPRRSRQGPGGRPTSSKWRAVVCSQLRWRSGDIVIMTRCLPPPRPRAASSRGAWRATPRTCAESELADAPDSKSGATRVAWGFNSPLRHQDYAEQEERPLSRV